MTWLHPLRDITRVLAFDPDDSSAFAADIGEYCSSGVRIVEVGMSGSPEVFGPLPPGPAKEVAVHRTPESTRATRN